MRFALLIVLGVVCLAWLGLHLRARHARGRERSADLVELRKLCDEDIGLLGEELRRLDAETTAHPLDDAARGDYEAARDAHKTAQRMFGEVTDANEISKVTETLASGGYALACLRARVEGRPVPELRVPCFLNPQHGPRSIDVAFTPPGSRHPQGARLRDATRRGTETEVRSRRPARSRSAGVGCRTTRQATPSLRTARATSRAMSPSRDSS